MDWMTELSGGVFMRFDLSFDARRVVFGYRPAPERAFRLYEAEVDGSGLKQLTVDSPGEAEQLASYGLDPPLLRVDVRAKSNSWVELGKREGEYFARRSADDAVLHVGLASGWGSGAAARERENEQGLDSGSEHLHLSRLGRLPRRRRITRVPFFSSSSGYSMRT